MSNFLGNALGVPYYTPMGLQSQGEGYKTSATAEDTGYVTGSGGSGLKVFVTADSNGKVTQLLIDPSNIGSGYAIGDCLYVNQTTRALNGVKYTMECVFYVGAVTQLSGYVGGVIGLRAGGTGAVFWDKQFNIEVTYPVMDLLLPPISYTGTAGAAEGYSISGRQISVRNLYQTTPITIRGNGLDGVLYGSEQRATTTATLLPHVSRFVATSGTFTLTLPSYAVLPVTGGEALDIGKTYYIENRGTGVLTLDGNGSETIDGATTKTMAAGTSLLLIKKFTGTATFSWVTTAVTTNTNLSYFTLPVGFECVLQANGNGYWDVVSRNRFVDNTVQLELAGTSNVITPFDTFISAKSASAVTVTLPPTSSVEQGHSILITNIGSASGALTVAPSPAASNPFGILDTVAVGTVAVGNSAIYVRCAPELGSTGGTWRTAPAAALV